MRVLVLAPFSSHALERLRRRVDVTHESWLETRRLWDPEKLGQRLHAEGYGALIVEADFVFTETFDAAPGLRFVGICRNATNQVDIDAATGRGVVVVNAPARNAVAVAELTLGLMLSLARGIPRADAFVKAREWRDPTEAYVRLRGREVSGSTVGVVGLGRIGSEVARRCAALGARVLASDPFVTARRARAVGATLVDLYTLLRRSDFVTIHASAPAGGKPVIDARALRKMKRGAYLLNLGAASALDYGALADVLSEGRIAGAGLDVYEGHPVPPSSPLLDLPNVVLTPHIGGATVETVERHSRMIAEDLERFLRGLPPRRLVNPEVMRARV